MHEVDIQTVQQQKSSAIAWFGNGWSASECAGLADAVGFSKERVGYILHEELKIKKFCTRWVPHLLTVDQKRIRMRIKFLKIVWIRLIKIKCIH